MVSTYLVDCLVVEHGSSTTASVATDRTLKIYMPKIELKEIGVSFYQSLIPYSLGLGIEIHFIRGPRC